MKALPADVGTDGRDREDQPEKNSQSDQAFFQWQTFFVWRDTLAQWIMAGSGIAAVFISAWAVILLRRTLGATRMANAAAMRAAQATETAVAVTRDTAQRQLRAYLGIVKINFIPQPAKDGSISPRHAKISIHNSGQTPAYNVVGFFNWHWFSTDVTDLPEDFAFPDYSKGQITSIVIGGGEDESITFIIDQEIFRKYIKKEINVFFYGHIDYTDIFDRPQRVNFCYSHFRMDDGTVGLAVYKRYNDAT